MFNEKDNEVLRFLEMRKYLLYYLIVKFKNRGFFFKFKQLKCNLCNQLWEQ